jgi:carbon storage regulator CsrA
MLVLSRKVGEKIRIGEDVTVVVVAVDGNRVRLAFDAPPNVRIMRNELIDKERYISRDRPRIVREAASAAAELVLSH